MLHQISLFTTGTDIKGLAVGTAGRVLIDQGAADPAFGVVAAPRCRAPK